ncbi:MAG: tetratricopeptide repeat-containing sensor histidine kinase [Bacteroidales bacterium]|nr:tetratricopeptide repeat-containing sensor histidine kinase [Bacteroidales bacterium]
MLKNKIFILILGLFLCLNLFGQQVSLAFTGNKNVDELLVKAEESRDSFEKTIKIANEALKVAKKEGKYEEAAVLLYIANLYKDNYQFKEAEMNFTRAIRNFELIKDRENVAESWYELGALYQIQGLHSKGIEFFNKAALEFQIQGNKKSEAKALNEIGYSNFQRTNYSEALKYFFKSQNIKEAIGDSLGLATTLNNLGLIYFEIGDYEKSVEAYLKAFRIWEKLEDDLAKAKLLNNIGLVYSDWGSFDFAKDYFHKSLEIRLQKNDTKGISSSYNNLGTVFLREKNYEKALEYYEKSKNLKQEMNFPMGLANSYNNIGYTFLLMEKNDSAMYYFEKSLEIKMQIGDLKGTINTYSNIGRTYLTLNNSNLALSFFKKAENLADSLGLNKYLIEIYLGLSDTYNSKKNCTMAFEYFKKYFEKKDEIFSQSSLRMISQVNSKYELEASEKENQILKQKNELIDLELKKEKTFKRFMVFLFILGAIVVILIIYYYFSKQKSTRELKYKNEELLHANEKLKVSEYHLRELNATKDKFFSIIAHDLKNPFSALLGLTDLLDRKVSRLEKDEIKNYTTNIYKSANSVYAILENLLQWSRSQSGKLAFHPEEIDLQNIINTNIALLSLGAEKKGVLIESFVKPGTFVWADEQLLNTILRNIIGNAVKFSQFNGKVEISCRNMQDFVEISIKDDGVGISKNDQEKLFRIDENFSTQGTSNETGTGLGLIICKEFIEKHGGTIRIESEIDRGSNFAFTIPAFSRPKNFKFSNGK